MSTDTIGLVSGLIVVLSIIPYFVRTYQGKIQPNLTSWSLWTLIGLALLVTYRSSGAKANLWPAVFGFINPLGITILVWWRFGGWKKPARMEIGCIIFSLLSLGFWIAVHDKQEMAQYALYLAIIADIFAAIPTIVFVWTEPDGDRPFAWTLFAIGYGLAGFAISDHTIVNYVLPIYMFLAALSIMLPLALYRWKQKIPLSEWI